MLKQEYFTDSPRETIELGKRIGKRLKGGEIIAFLGGLGSGKTTITRGIVTGMGLSDMVTSPTFAIVNEYREEGRLFVCHFDMYRLCSDELEDIGFFDYLDGGGVIIIEWSENITDLLSRLDNVIYIEIKRLSEDKRQFIIEHRSGGGRLDNLGH